MSKTKKKQLPLSDSSRDPKGKESPLPQGEQVSTVHLEDLPAPRTGLTGAELADYFCGNSGL
jgi:hypothetical protein